MQEEKLWDIHQLLKHYPAFTEWGIRHRLRMRDIPIVRISRRIYFCPSEIARWIEQHKINPLEKHGGK
jgi:hypothetical protein